MIDSLVFGILLVAWRLRKTLGGLSFDVGETSLLGILGGVVNAVHSGKPKVGEEWSETSSENAFRKVATHATWTEQSSNCPPPSYAARSPDQQTVATR